MTALVLVTQRILKLFTDTCLFLCSTTVLELKEMGNYLPHLGHVWKISVHDHTSSAMAREHASIMDQHLVFGLRP